MICPLCYPLIRSGDGLACRICGLVVTDKDDEATGWALRALHAHHQNEHDRGVGTALVWIDALAAAQGSQE